MPITAAHMARVAAFEWRLAWLRRRGSLLLYAIPVGVAALGAVFMRLGWITAQGSDALGAVVGVLFFSFLVVLAPLVFGVGLVLPEAESRTLVYLLVRPVGRPSLFLGKFLGAWMAASVLLVGSLLLAALLLLGAGGGDVGPALLRLPRQALVLVVGALAYGSLFALLGLVLARPVLFAVFLGFGWESAIPFLPGWIKALTVRHHLAALLPAEGLPAGLRAALDPPGVAAGSAWLLASSLVALALAAWVFARRDFP